MKEEGLRKELVTLTLEGRRNDGKQETHACTPASDWYHARVTTRDRERENAASNASSLLASRLLTFQSLSFVGYTP